MTDALDARRRLEALLGHSFAKSDLLTEALTHRSASSVDSPSNERLEFLGDRILGLVIAELLIKRFPEADEGELSRRLTSLVRRDALAKVAKSVGLGAHMRFGASDAKAGRANATLLADACEATIGALFLDGGMDAAQSFITTAWEPMIEDGTGAARDAKTRLQEWAQGRGKPLPHYEISSRKGPPHAPQFVVTVAVDGEGEASGEGSSKRVAEQAAAAALLDHLNVVPEKRR